LPPAVCIIHRSLYQVSPAFSTPTGEELQGLVEKIIVGLTKRPTRLGCVVEEGA